VCGNNLVEAGEACDGTMFAGATCKDYGFSKADGLVCAGCMIDPSGCKTTCDGVLLEAGEICDGANLGGKDCTSFGFVNPLGLACAPGCQAYQAQGCKATCGNNVAEPGEKCDGNDLGGQTCVSLGFPGGTLSCKACALDTTACGPICGNNIIEPGEQCDDGNMMSGDGCSSTCQAEGTTCNSAVQVKFASYGTQTFGGSTTGGGAHTGTQCMGSAGADRVYAVTVPNNEGFLTASLSRAGTSYESVLYVTKGCQDNQSNDAILCPDSIVPGAGGGEVASFRVSPGATYYVFVDGFGGMDDGAYQLTLDFSYGANCLDPVPIPLEPGGGMMLLGATPGLTGTTGGSCGGGLPDDVVYQVTSSTNGDMQLLTDPMITDYNSVIYARTQCGAGLTEVGCNNAFSNNGGDTLSVKMTAGAPVFVWVDGTNVGGNKTSGNYGLLVTPP
jgi:cysteine-rich repeat protein